MLNRLSMTEERRTPLRLAFLQMIGTFLDARCQDSTLFGTLIDSWYCHYRGGIFVKSTGNPRTLNNPRPGSPEFEAMRQLPWHSQAAGEILFEGRPGRVVKDHTLPRSYLHRQALQLPSTAPDEIEAFLLANYCVAALTKGEHDALEHRHAMPEGWTDPLARYDGIDRYVRSEPKPV